MTYLQSLRNRSFDDQGGTCYYCQQPMWRTNAAAFVRRHGLTSGQGHLMRVTAEHLRARSDGGLDLVSNVVAACLFCNCHRHRAKAPLPPEKFLRQVRARVAAGKWHGVCLR